MLPADWLPPESGYFLAKVTSRELAAATSSLASPDLWPGLKLLSPVQIRRTLV